MEDDVKTLGDYLSIAWRRKFHILIPFIVVLLITVATVLLLPPVYKSTGTILIESQQIPKELIQSTVTTFAGSASWNAWPPGDRGTCSSCSAKWTP